MNSIFKCYVNNLEHCKKKKKARQTPMRHLKPRHLKSTSDNLLKSISVLLLSDPTAVPNHSAFHIEFPQRGITLAPHSSQLEHIESKLWLSLRTLKRLFRRWKGLNFFLWGNSVSKYYSLSEDV